jgi:hypothetical protein
MMLVVTIGAVIISSSGRDDIGRALFSFGQNAGVFYFGFGCCCCCRLLPLSLDDERASDRPTKRIPTTI